MSTSVAISSFPSPFGTIWLASAAEGLCGLLLRGSRGVLEMRVRARMGDLRFQVDHLANSEPVQQLKEYFRGERKQFQLPLDLRGTPFQRKVWNALQEIPYGETRAYAEIAVVVGNPRAVRAVGHANGRNPIPIIVPCHRVIRTNGSLGGYGGGLDVKESLLALEARNK